MFTTRVEIDASRRFLTPRVNVIGVTVFRKRIPKLLLIGIWLTGMAFVAYTVTMELVGAAPVSIGAIAFSLMILLVVANISNILTLFMSRAYMLGAKSAWLVCVFLVVLLDIYLCVSVQSFPSDAELVAIWLVLVAAFPISLVVAAVIALFGTIMGPGEMPVLFERVVMHLLTIVLGYAQWYILFPRIFEKTRRKNVVSI